MKTLTYRFLSLALLAMLCFSLKVQAQGVADPATFKVYAVTDSIKIDGKLDDPAWSAQLPYILFKKDGVPSWYGSTPSGGAIVKGVYTATSQAKLRFLHKGQDLYISVESDDKSVCKFGWEGDGVFMKMKDAAGAEHEIKLYVMLPSTNIPYMGLDANNNFPAGSLRGAAQPGVGTTILDSANVDGGYTLEAVVHLDKLGYASTAVTIPINAVWFDSQDYNLADFVTGKGEWGPTGKYYKQWWGSEWGTDKTVTLMASVLPVEMTSFTANVSNGLVSLNWSTATELNNKGFDVERSFDKTNFTKVAFVDGKGTTSKVSAYSYSEKISAGKSYFYRLRQVDFDGTSKLSNVVEAKSTIPTQFTMAQNYPNPFNPSTNVRFDLPVNSKVAVQVYNLLGQVVATLANGDYSAGSHELSFNASSLSSGIYVYSIKAVGQDGSNFSSTKKMSLLK